MRRKSGIIGFIGFYDLLEKIKELEKEVKE